MLKIDKNVPPPSPRKAHGPTKYPWLEMKVNDSFFLPNGSLPNMRSSASRAGRIYKVNFKAQVVEGGVRVWRVK